MKPSFSLIELIIVIVVMGILASIFIVPTNINKLQLAADTLKKYIDFTHSLALKDDKYLPFPKDSSKIEQNRSKYWFKQWWQIRIAKTRDGMFFMEIFSDQPIDTSQNFDKLGYTPSSLKNISIAHDENGKLLIGNCGGSFPNCGLINRELNLSKFEISKIEFGEKEISSSRSGRLIFDNFGNVFLDEGEAGDGGDINPLDIKRKLLTKEINITLYDKYNRCLQVRVTPTGMTYINKCN